jgi:hypothetical protein
MEFDKEHKCSDIMCDVCHKTFRDIGSVKLYLCVLTGECPYHCAMVNKTFSNKRNLKVHSMYILGSIDITVKSVIEHSVSELS